MQELPVSEIYATRPVTYANLAPIENHRCGASFTAGTKTCSSCGAVRVPRYDLVIDIEANQFGRPVRCNEIGGKDAIRRAGIARLGPGWAQLLHCTRYAALGPARKLFVGMRYGWVHHTSSLGMNVLVDTSTREHSTY